jgi:hypothetical protein
MSFLSGSDGESGGEDDEGGAEMMQAFAEMLSSGDGPMKGHGQGHGIQDADLRQMWDLLASAEDESGASERDFPDFRSFFENEGDSSAAQRGSKAGQGRARRERENGKKATGKGFGGASGARKKRDGKSSHPVV